MYVNPDDAKVKQLHADIGKTLPEQIKLTKDTPSLYGGGKVKYRSIGGKVGGNDVIKMIYD